MLSKISYTPHKATNLHVYFSKYLKKIENLKRGTPFRKSHFTNTSFATHILKKYKGKTSLLHSLIENFQKSFLSLPTNERKRFIKVFKDTNDIEWIFNNPTKAVRKATYPVNMGAPTHTLFVHLFENCLGLTAFDMKGHYLKFYDSRKDGWCPFCGLEKYKIPERQKEDYDHLLCKKHYPVAAVNFNNLVPMGDRCNRIYKKDKDILKSKVGLPTKVANPFKEIINPKLSLDGSIVHANPLKRTWHIAIKPNNQKIQRWDEIFCITERFKEDFLIKRRNSKQLPEYDMLIDSLTKICKARRLASGVSWSITDLNRELDILIVGHKDYIYMDRNIFKLAVYEFIRHNLSANNKKALLKTINTN